MAIITIKKSPQHSRCKSVNPLTSTFAVATLLLSPYANAAAWRVTSTLDLRETYTDNVRLASPATQSDFITDISPGVSISADGPRLKVKSKYAFHYLHYLRDAQGHSIFHQLDADAKAELIENFLFLDGAAAVSQQNISPLGPQSTDISSVNGNRTNIKTYRVSPYITNRFGSVATSELRYTHSSVSASTGGLQDTQNDGVSLNVNSGDTFRTLGWGLQYIYNKNTYDNAQDVANTSLTGNLRYKVTPQFYLTATGGYDKYKYVSATTEPEGAFYAAGFSWKPSERTSISAGAGNRFFGKTYSLQASVRSRRSVWHVSYIEEITTTQSQFAIPVTNNTSDLLNQLFLSSIPDPVQRQQAIDRLGLPATITQQFNYFTNQYFLQKNLQASVAITGARNTGIFSVFNIKRESQTAAGLIGGFPGTDSQTFDGSTHQQGVNALWNWRITPVTSANFNAGYSRTQQESTDAEQRLRTYRIALARQFQPKLGGVLELRRVNQTSDLAGSNFTENAVSASLSMRF